MEGSEHSLLQPERRKHLVLHINPVAQNSEIIDSDLSINMVYGIGLKKTVNLFKMTKAI